MLKASGLGVFSFPGISGEIDFSTFDRKTRIVAARAGVNADPIHTRKVPKKWLSHQRAIRKVTDSLRKKFEGKPFVGSLSFVPTERMEGGVFYSEPEISVRPDATDEQIARLPDSLESAGIASPRDLVGSNVRVRRMNGEFVNHSVDCYRGVSDGPFPGGLEIKDGNTSAFGTGGCRATDGTNEYLYTANHVVADSYNVGTSGVDDADGDRLGSGEDGHKTHDWLMVNDNSANYGDTIQFEEGEVTVHGYATQNGMESIQGQTGTLKSQGVISGRQDAHVKGGGASYYSGCAQMYGSATKLGTPDYVRDGDSGGPFWWPTSDGNHVVTVLTGSENRKDYTGCNVSGKAGRPAYGYPFWRVANNTKYTIK